MTNSTFRAQVTEPDIYSAVSRNSFFYDMLRSNQGDKAAGERMRRHAAHEAPEVARREARKGGAFRDHAAVNGLEARVNPNDQLGTGGEFTPPLWLIDQFASSSRAGRPLGDLLNPLPLPKGVHSINVPRMTTGSLAGPQAYNGEPLASQDLVTAAVSSNVCTIGGLLDVSQQLEDQAPAGFDTYAYVDLKRAYNKALEAQLMFGTGVGDQLLGVTNVSGVTSVANAGGSFSDGSFWNNLGSVAAGVGNARLLPPEAWFMAPRRWAWIASSVDGSKRPIASPGNAGPFTALQAPFEGGALAVGPVLGFPVYQDGALLNLGAAGNDIVVACRPSDMMLWESDDKFMVTVNATAGTLQARIVLARYTAFLPHRYPTGIGLLTGCTQPMGF